MWEYKWRKQGIYESLPVKIQTTIKSREDGDQTRQVVCYDFPAENFSQWPLPRPGTVIISQLEVDRNISKPTKSANNNPTRNRKMSNETVIVGLHIFVTLSFLLLRRFSSFKIIISRRIVYSLKSRLFKQIGWK